MNNDDGIRLHNKGKPSPIPCSLHCSSNSTVASNPRICLAVVVRCPPLRVRLVFVSPYSFVCLVVVFCCPPSRICFIVVSDLLPSFNPPSVAVESPPFLLPHSFVWALQSAVRLCTVSTYLFLSPSYHHSPIFKIWYVSPLF